MSKKPTSKLPRMSALSEAILDAIQDQFMLTPEADNRTVAGKVAHKLDAQLKRAGFKRLAHQRQRVLQEMVTEKEGE